LTVNAEPFYAGRRDKFFSKIEIGASAAKPPPPEAISRLKF
jgi:hypothetical protein